MRVKSVIFGLLLIIASLGVSHAATLSVRGFNATATTIEWPDTNTLKMTGSVHLENQDKTAKTSFDATAKVLTVRFFEKTQQKSTGMGAVKSATMDGPVKLVYVEPDEAGNMVKTTVTADNATFEGAQQLVTLIGRVNITRESGGDTVVMTGDRGYFSLKPELTGGPRFKVESLENAVSTIDLTSMPKPKKESK